MVVNQFASFIPVKVAIIASVPIPIDQAMKSKVQVRFSILRYGMCDYSFLLYGSKLAPNAKIYDQYSLLLQSTTLSNFSE